MRGGPLAVLLCVASLAVSPTGAEASEAHGTRSFPSPDAATPSTGSGSAGSNSADSSPTGSSSTGNSPTGNSPTDSSPAGTISADSSSPTSAVVVFLAPGRQPAGRSESDAIERELVSIPTLSTGILSATQGSYTSAQFVLDTTQGARVSNSAYKPAKPPFLALPIPSDKASGQAASSQVQAWPSVLAHAHSAPQLLSPGLLAAQVPGGAAYVPANGVEAVNGVLAADQRGHVAAVLGSSSTTLASIDRLRAHHRLVVADLPTGTSGYADLRALAASRAAGELLVVIQRAPDQPNDTTVGQTGNELLWIALAGIGKGGHTLTSQSTNQRGLVAAIDVGPTILDHLGLPIPADMRGRAIRIDGTLDGASLSALRSRLLVIDSRRLPAVAWLVGCWALLLAAERLLTRRRSQPSIDGAPDTRGTHAARETHGTHAARETHSTHAAHHPHDTHRPHGTHAGWTMRVGALALLWTPVAVLLPAALEPSRTVELALLVAVCFALAALTDRLVPWPRAPLAPAIAAVLALTIDALAGTQLLMRSLLGPSPAFGARFYGIGNELKSGLAVLVFSAVAAALYPAVRSRRAATTMACAGLLLAIVEGSARIGAGVGGVILVSAGTAVATVMLLPGSLNRNRVLIAMAAPVVGLVALAAVDLATAHGSGHFTGSVLDARSTGDIRDIIVRRYGAAWDELRNHLMPLATALALVASVVGVRRRAQVCAPVNSDPAWLAALCGGLTAGVIGALTEDSGPVLLVVAVFVLGCVLSYLWGKPSSVETVTPRSPDTLPATRSHALRRSAAPSG